MPLTDCPRVSGAGMLKVRSLPLAKPGAHEHHSTSQPDMRVFLFTTCVLLIAATAAAATNTDHKTAASDEELVARIDRLIDQLGDNQYTVREHAQQELTKLGATAFDALEAVEHHRDPEVAHRARYLVQSIRAQMHEGDPPSVREKLQNYDTLSDAERLECMRQLARMSDQQGISALCRLVRFERSAQLSKLGALLIINDRRPAAADWPVRSKNILDQVTLSKRPAARWLAAYARFPTRPEESLAEWVELVAEEEATARRLPTAEQRQIVAGLLRQQVIMQLSQHAREEALASLRRMMDFEPGNPESLAELLQWIVTQKAWDLIDEVAERYEKHIAGNPDLLYAMAHARSAQGNEKLADELAAKALEFHPGDPQRHWQMAYKLKEQGLAKYAEREFRAVIESGGDPRFAMVARVMLSDLVYDQERFSDAADLLDAVVAEMNQVAKNNNRMRVDLIRSPTEIRARACFFRSRQYAQENKPEKQLEELNKALTHDPREVDSLIALYRYGDRNPQEKQRAKELAAKAAAYYRQKINVSPKDDQLLNQYAWLIANTEGDLDEATQFSHRSVELQPAAGGYFDTLAHCYAAKKDFAKAVEYQTRAIELDPHSQEIKRAYDRFKAEAEKAGRADKR